MEVSTFVSMKAPVEFVDVLSQYASQEDMVCKYQFNDYTPQEGDRIAIFKLGWTQIKEYILFEWAPTDSNAKTHHVIFSKHVLPKNNTDLFQTCYISGENELHGASSPFQFMEPLPRSINPYNMIMKSSMRESKSYKTKAKIDGEYEKEFLELREENSVLKAALKALSSKTNEEGKNYDKDIADLREIIDSLKTALTQQQQEINVLKMKIKQCGEEYTKLYLEKMKLENKVQKEKLEKPKGIGRQVITSVMNESDIDLSNLPSLPPFPILK